MVSLLYSSYRRPNQIVKLPVPTTIMDHPPTQFTELISYLSESTIQALIDTYSVNTCQISQVIRDLVAYSNNNCT
jgi:hypothetical protein